MSRRVACRQKEGEVARVVLTASEELAGLVCQLAVLPVVRSPLVRTPLRMADWVGGTGAALLQKAVPRLTDTKQVGEVGSWTRLLSVRVSLSFLKNYVKRKIVLFFMTLI